VLVSWKYEALLPDSELLVLDKKDPVEETVKLSWDWDLGFIGNAR
jgi:hypothetical protein